MSTEQARMESVQSSGMGSTESTHPHAEDPTYTGGATGQTGGGPAEGAPQAAGGAASSTAEAAGRKTEADLPKELREFGKQIEAVISTARTSPRGREIEEQLTTAWRDVEKGVNTTLSKAQSADFKGTVTGTAQYAAEELQVTLARGLRSLNQWLGQRVQEAEERRKRREQDISRAAAEGTADDDVRDRFGGEAPVFGHDLNVPTAPVHVTPDPSAAESSESVLTERFDDRPPSFRGPTSN